MALATAADNSSRTNPTIKASHQQKHRRLQSCTPARPCSGRGGSAGEGQVSVQGCAFALPSPRRDHPKAHESAPTAVLPGGAASARLGRRGSPSSRSCSAVPRPPPRCVNDGGRTSPGSSEPLWHGSIADRLLELVGVGGGRSDGFRRLHLVCKQFARFFRSESIDCMHSVRDLGPQEQKVLRAWSFGLHV